MRLIRFVTDLRSLNARIGQFTYATSLDLNSGYYTIRLIPNAQNICTIILPWGGLTISCVTCVLSVRRIIELYFWVYRYISLFVFASWLFCVLPWRLDAFILFQSMRNDTSKNMSRLKTSWAGVRMVIACTLLLIEQAQFDIIPVKGSLGSSVCWSSSTIRSQRHAGTGMIWKGVLLSQTSSLHLFLNSSNVPFCLASFFLAACKHCNHLGFVGTSFTTVNAWPRHNILTTSKSRFTNSSKVT